MLIVSSSTSGAMYLWDVQNNPRNQKEMLGKIPVKKCLVRTCRWACGHRPLGAHPLIRGDVDGVRGRVVTDSQTQVGDRTGAVLLHEDVLGLQVSVGDAWLSYRDINEHDNHLQILISVHVNLIVLNLMGKLETNTIFTFWALQFSSAIPKGVQYIVVDIYYKFTKYFSRHLSIIYPFLLHKLQQKYSDVPSIIEGNLQELIY